MSHSASLAAISNTLQRVGAQLLVRGWLSSNSVVFIDHGRDVGVVVDTGYVSHAEQTVALLRRATGGRPLAAIVNTHLHSDHCGGNASLQSAWPEATIAVPAGYRQALVPWDESKLSYLRTGQRCAPFKPDQFLEPGSVVSLGDAQWEVHAAPGHDPDAVLLFEPRERILISGDALWQSRLAIIFPELTGEPGFAAAQDALDLIERLDPRLVLPGHGGAFTDVSGALDQSRARLHAFSVTPDRHRRHAVRALVMYHMLEHQRLDRDALLTWMINTPIFAETLGCTHDAEVARQLASETIDGLISDSILQCAGQHLAIVDPG